MFIPRTLISLALAASTVFAHSNMFFPIPREDKSHTFDDASFNSCENDNTFVPNQNVFQRGQQVPVKWWWNNHDGGFIKMSLIKTNAGFVDKEGVAALNHRVNVIQGQCYTRACERNGFDPGNTQACIGRDMEIPNWVSDGTYILQWSHFGGFNSQQVPTRQLPIYHTCANIRIQGGVPEQRRPDDWVAPFFGGDVFKVNEQQATQDQCAFKNFQEEPQPSQVNVLDDRSDNIQLGGPTGGWAASGYSYWKRADKVILPRLGHIARYAKERVEEA